MTSEDSKQKQAFLTQARYCRDLDSPFMVRLLTLLAERLDDSSAVSARLIDFPFSGFVWDVAMPLRIAGALHMLVLNGADTALAAVYPPHDRDADDDALWQAVVNAMIRHEAFILDFLASAPQTNEVRRSVALLPGFLTIAAHTELPLLLSELGASAGINQCWDCYGYRLGEFRWGDPDAAVQLTTDWRGPPPPSAALEVVSRAACDLNPPDAGSAEGRQRLLSYIWADQGHRFELTRAALDILAAKRYPVARANIDDWLPARLAEPPRNAVHVIYHTIVWHYQDKAAQAANRALIETAGKRANRESPLAWLRLEPDGKDPGAAITLTLWPDGDEHCLGRADYHGRWVDWLGWPGRI